MKNASALYLELMDGVSENKEERGRERQKIEKKVLRPLWGGVIVVACLFFQPFPFHVNLLLLFSLHSP